MEQLGANGLADGMKQFYDRKLLSKPHLDTIFMDYGQKRPIPPRWGKSVEFRRYEKITMTAGSYTLPTEGSVTAAIAATITAVTATISQYGQHSKITDILETQNIDPIISEYAELYRLAMAEGLDIVVREEFSNATTIQYADAAARVGTSGTGAVGSGNYLDGAEILEAARTLKRNGARKPYRMFLHPDNTKDCFEDPDIVDSFLHAESRGGGNPMFTGQIGRWGGVEFLETNNLKINSSYGMSGADVYEVVIFGSEFYGVTELSAHAARMIIHPRGTGGHLDPLEQYSTIGWKAAMATKILNNDFGVLVYCASSRSNAA